MDSKLVLVLVALLSATALYISASGEQDTYLQWKKQYNFEATAEEDGFRRLIFLRNVEIIEKHNSDHTQTYKMGLNQFSALTDA